MLWLAIRFPRLPLDVFLADTPKDSQAEFAHKPTFVFNHNAGKKSVLFANDRALALGVCRGMNVSTADALLTAQSTSLTKDNSLFSNNHEQPQSSTGLDKSLTHISLGQNTQLEWFYLQKFADACYDFTSYVKLHNTPTLETRLHSCNGNETLDSDKAKQTFKINSQSFTEKNTDKDQPTYLQPGLLLEISGSLKLFFGLEKIKQQLAEYFAETNIQICFGVGLTPESAWALTHSHISINEHSSIHEFLALLNNIRIQQLDCYQSAFKKMAKMGIRTLEDVFKIPHSELGKRFGNGFVDYIQQLKGLRQNVRHRPSENHYFQQKRDLDFPIQNTQLLEHDSRQLIQQLLIFLKTQQLQCEGVEWVLGDRYQSITIAVLCQPIYADGELLQELTQLHFDHLQLSFEVNYIELKLTHSSALQHSSDEIFQYDNNGLNKNEVQRQWQLLLTKLHNRLDANAIVEPNPQTEHLPEQQNHWQHSSIQRQGSNQLSYKKTSEQKLKKNTYLQQDLLSAAHSSSDEQAHNPSTPLCSTVFDPKPTWLLEPPICINHREDQLCWHGPLTILQGPERIQSQWWTNTGDVYRDYFIAEQNDFRRVWIYQDKHTQQWFVQGIFS